MKDAPNLKGLSESVRKFCQERDWDQFHTPKELAIGLVTESAELLDIFRFQNETQTTELMTKVESRKAVADELADILFFLLRFADRNDFDLADCLHQKIEKNAEKYPIEKSKGSNQKYTSLQGS